MEKIIQILMQEIRVVTKKFHKAQDMDNYSKMATLASYSDALEFALRIVELEKDAKETT